LHQSLAPQARLVPFYHSRDDVLPRQPQYAQNIAMGCARIIIKELDSPIVFSSDLSGCSQDDWLEYLPRFGRLHGPNEAMATIAVTHLTLAPLLLGSEQTLDGAKLRERVVAKQA
jgi:hypothetical protein